MGNKNTYIDSRLRGNDLTGSVGFTLIELLVVIAIIGILAGISVFSFGNIQKSARDGKRKADLENIRSALEIYRTDCRTYPATASFVIKTATSLIGPTTIDSCKNIIYMNTTPTDTISTYWYYYLKGVTNNTYTLCSHIENPISPLTSATLPACGDNCGGTAGLSCNYAVYNP